MLLGPAQPGIRYARSQKMRPSNPSCALVSTICVAAVLASTAAEAHSGSKGTARFDVRDDGVVAVSLEIPEGDLMDLADVDLSSPTEAAEARAGMLLGRLSTRLPMWLKVEGDDRSCPLAVTGWSEPKLRVVRIECEAKCAEQPLELTVHWGVSKATKLDLMAVAMITAPGGIEHPVIFSKSKTKAVVIVKRPSALRVFADFVTSGAEHIVTGWDHLAFLLALMLACATLRRLLLVATGFTIAHSITLALGALDVVRLSSELVEPVIAASIAIAAATGLLRLRRGTLAYPGSTGPTRGALVELALVSSFGLVHGLGFAAMLKDALSEAGSVVVPLLAFNVGVELGQVACVAIAFPLLVLVGRSRVARPVMAALLVGLVLLGLGVTGARLLGA